ncbi:MAG: hypothetical protein ABR568_06995 [Pyrinomonadaceae bacterium]
MKVSFTHYSPDAPIRSRYQQGADFLVHDFDLGSEEAFYLLKELKNHRSSLRVDAAACSLNFYIEGDGSLRVEIYGNNGLWADSEVDITVATEIFRIAFEGGEFGAIMPVTNREWDAYSGID